MKFPSEFVDKVREANNLVDIIGQYTQLRPSGSNFMGRCPFPDHNDKTASFSVSEDKQLYNCFGCKKSGNIFTFLQVFNGYSFPEAITYLARRANIAIPEGDEDPREKRARELKESVLSVNRLAASYFCDVFSKLPQDHPVRAYALKRGLTDELIAKFNIGYAPEEWHGLARVLSARRISPEIGVKAGLIKASSRTGNEAYFDLFRGRLMFPIVTTAGDVVGFGGRILGEGEPKYLNSPETPVFHKGRTLYGLDVTARYIRSNDEVIVVEGYMDALALYRSGIQNVAAILGTAFTPEHGKLVRRMTPNVVMLLDGDNAGILGAERSLPALLAADIRPRGLILPEGLDPDEFIESRGVEALKAEIAKATDLFTLLLTRHWMEGYRATPQDKLRVVESVGRALLPAGLGVLDQPLADLFVEETARQLDVEPGWVGRTLYAAMAKGVRTSNPIPQGQESAAGVGPAATGPNSNQPTGLTQENLGEIDLEGIGREELAALGLLLQSRFLMQDLSEASKEWLALGASREEHPIAQMLIHEGARKLVGIALRKYGQQPEAFATLAASLLGNLKNAETLTKSLAEVQSSLGVKSSENSENSSSDLEAAAEVAAESDRRRMAKVLNAIQKRRKQDDLNQISISLRKNDQTPEQNQELMKKFVLIQRELRAIENELRSFDRE